MKRYLLFSLKLYLFIFLPLLCSGQSEEVLPEPQSSLTSYFKMPRESIHLHLNKTVYVEGEEIWFAGYIFNRKIEKPFQETANIYVGIYDSIGNQKDKFLFLGREGYMNGNIYIDSNYASGTYYLKASTSWMRNFKEDDSFVEKIKILSPASQLKKNTRSNMEYDVQFLPEGGNLVAEIVNNVGVKILNEQGYGAQIQEGHVFDNEGNPITKFSSNELGMARFDFTPKKGLLYYADIRFLNGDIKKYDLPGQKRFGVNVKVQSNPNLENIGLVFETNKETQRQLKDKNFYFLIHKDGDSKKTHFNFNKSKVAKFFLAKNDLKKGVNTITLFDEKNNPILERMVFNRTGIASQTPSVKLQQLPKDSLLVEIEKAIPNAKLSISVLPKNTLAYDQESSVFSTMYLSPYLSGFIENPNYYFGDVSDQKDYDLDLLLLTQGWSRYEWNDIFYHPPMESHAFEDGMVLEGTVQIQKPRFNGNIILHGTAHHGQQLIPINQEQNKFFITSFFPEKDEKLYFSFADKKGNLTKPGTYVALTNAMYADRVLKTWTENPEYKNDMEEVNVSNVENIISDRTIQLDEVVISEVKKTTVSEDNVFTPAFLKNKLKEIDRRAVNDHILFTDLIRSLEPYDVTEGLGSVSIRSRRGGGVNLVLDGMRLPNLDALYRLPTGQVESYFFDRLSRYEGTMAGFRETLYVFLRRGEELLGEADIDFPKATEITVNNGFERPKTFYMPKYTTFFSKAFENFGTIHWITDLETNTNGNGKFKILNTGVEEISFFIEGMSTNGRFLSSEVTVNVPSSK